MQQTGTQHLLLQWLYRTIKGTSETISRILQLYNIHIAHKPTTTLRHLLTNATDRDKPNKRQRAVCKIKCSNSQASYIGETGRNLSTRLTEHKQATRNGDVYSHIAVYHQLTENIDWDTAHSLPTEQTIFHNWLWKAGALHVTWNKWLMTNFHHYHHDTTDKTYNIQFYSEPPSPGRLHYTKYWNSLSKYNKLINI